MSDEPSEGRRSLAENGDADRPVRGDVMPGTRTQALGTALAASFAFAALVSACATARAQVPQSVAPAALPEAPDLGKSPG
jgi:hypothetical protein